MKSAARILVVEDEERIARLLCDNLEAEGYRVALARDGEAGLRALRDGGFDLVLLDVMMPRMDGFALCRTLRDEGNLVPILFLTARDLPSDRVQGLMAGGDDYLVKPFRLEELLARVHALLRRSQWGERPRRSRIAIGDAWVDLEARTCRNVQGEVEILPAKEAGILRLLLDARGGIVSRMEILQQVWGGEAEPTPRTVDNFVVRLRRRLEPDPGHPRFLLTVRGEGYRLALEAAEPPSGG